jgi:hypothetical protein
MLRAALFTSALLVASVGIPSRATGQQASVPVDTLPITLALVGELEPSGASAIILRRAGTDAGDVILLRHSDADGARLTTAVALLMLKRSERGFIPAADERIILTGHKPPVNWVPHGLPRFTADVARLRNASIRNIPGVGRVPAIQIWVPKVETRVRGGP